MNLNNLSKNLLHSKEGSPSDFLQCCTFSSLIQSLVLGNMELTLIHSFLSTLLSSLISSHDVFFFTTSQGK